MKHLEIEVRPLDCGLLVGGRTDSQRGADDATARDLRGHLILPASALRGALRIELERLLRGRGDAACRASGPADPDATHCTCPVCRLFGTEGVGTGTLRLDDARLEGEERVVDLRPRIAVSRATGTVSHQLLGFAETGEIDARGGARFRAPAWLVPRSEDERAGEALEQDRHHLAAACRALSALGGGKSRGLGWVECELLDVEAPVGEAARLPVRDALAIRFEAQAPLHLGSGRPLGYFHPTLSHAPSSAVRGALAFALLEQGLCSADDPGFQALFGPHAAVTFGSARVPGDTRSATRRRCRPGEHVFDDLVGEIVRREATRHGVALAVRPEAACPFPGCTPVKVAPAPEGDAIDAIQLRLHTRTAINRRTGTSLDARLFSIELVEPWLDGGAERLALTAEVRDLVPEAAELLVKLDGRQVSLGGKRSQGLGRCKVAITSAPGAGVDLARAAIEDLDRALREAWGEVDAAVPSLSRHLLAEHERPVAVVLTEPWLPREPQAYALGPLGEKPRHAFVSFQPHGRFGAVEARRWKAGEHVEVGELPPETAAAPGSTWVYWIDSGELERRLAEWSAAGRRGVDSLGRGRFRIRGPADPAADLEVTQ
jgi:CRISPR-associated protein Csx10